MSFSIVRTDDVPMGVGPHPAASPYDRHLSASLGIEHFGLYEVVIPPGASTEPHDHLADGVEDAYVVVRGSGWLVVDGERGTQWPSRRTLDASCGRARRAAR